MPRLTKKQIKRQDFVDNPIFELMQKLLPASKTVEWDIEAIGEIRDAIQAQVIGKKVVINEKQFYPYLKM